MLASRPGVLSFRWHNVVGIWIRQALAFRRSWVVESTAVVVEPVIVLGAIGFGLGRFVGDFEEGISFAEFVAPGIIAGNAMFHAIFEGSWGVYRRMETHRIYDAILTAPVAMRELVAGEMVWGATRALMTGVAVTAFAAALGLVDSPWAIGIVVAAVLIGLVFSGMGLIFAAITPSQHALVLVFTLVSTPMFFFSGAFFPIDTLPGWIQPLAWALPLTEGVHLARGLTTGNVGVTQLYDVLYMAGLIAVFYPLAIVLLRRRLLK